MVSVFTARDTGLQVVHEVSTILRAGQLGLAQGVPVGVVPRGALIQIMYFMPLRDLTATPAAVELQLGITPTGNEVLGALGAIQLNNLSSNFVNIADVGVNDLLHPQVIYASITSADLWATGALAVIVSYTPLIG